MTEEHKPVTWELTLKDAADPHGHWAKARQIDTQHWEAEYFRGSELIAKGRISTPPPHEPPVATLMATLASDREEADYWKRAETSDHG